MQSYLSDKSILASGGRHGSNEPREAMVAHNGEETLRNHVFDSMLDVKARISKPKRREWSRIESFGGNNSRKVDEILVATLEHKRTVFHIVARKQERHVRQTKCLAELRNGHICALVSRQAGEDEADKEELDERRSRVCQG